MLAEIVFDSGIEKRIEKEILVNAYNEYARAIKWVSYLSQHLTFPFQAQCSCKLPGSPLDVGSLVTVTGLNIKMCAKDMFVDVMWKDKTYPVPLIQLEGLQVNHETLQGITDWQYWVNCGYSF